MTATNSHDVQVEGSQSLAYYVDSIVALDPSCKFHDDPELRVSVTTRLGIPAAGRGPPAALRPAEPSDYLG